MWMLERQGTGTDHVLFRLAPGGTKTMGRGDEADLVLDAPLVSRVHCRLVTFDDRIVVTDLASTNGTYVNGVRAERGELVAGDTLRIGRVELAVRRFESDRD